MLYNFVKSVFTIFRWGNWGSQRENKYLWGSNWWTGHPARCFAYAFHAILPTTLGGILPILCIRKLRLRHHRTCPVTLLASDHGWSSTQSCLTPAPVFLTMASLVRLDHETMGPGSCHSQSPWPDSGPFERTRTETGASCPLLVTQPHKPSATLQTSSQSSWPRGKGFGLAAWIVGRLFCIFLWWDLVFLTEMFFRWGQGRVLCLPCSPPPKTHCDSQVLGTEQAWRWGGNWNESQNISQRNLSRQVSLCVRGGGLLWELLWELMGSGVQWVWQACQKTAGEAHQRSPHYTHTHTLHHVPAL